MTEAQQHFRLALEEAPANRQTHYLFGRSLIRTGQFGEAIAQLLETIQVEDDKTPVCMQALAAAYQRAGDLKSAAHYTREARKRALSRNMTNASLRGLGSSLGGAGALEVCGPCCQFLPLANVWETAPSQLVHCHDFP